MPLHCFIWVACGGALGAVARFGISGLVKAPVGFPWATLGVNLLGSFLMGLLVGWLSKQSGGHEGLRLFIGVGLLGGFTTFSAFSMELFQMLEKRELLAMSGYLGGSLVGGVLVFGAGYLLLKGL
jgi:CrcB protein